MENLTVSMMEIKELVYSNILSSVLRSSHRRCSVKKGVLRNFTKLTGKHLCQSLFFNKVVGQACNFIKKETLAQVFSCKFCEICKNTFSYRTALVAAKEYGGQDGRKNEGVSK